MKSGRIQERRNDTRNTELIAAGEVRKAELIEMAGGLLTSQVVASMLNTPKQTIGEQLQLIENEGWLPAGFAAAVEFVPYSGKTKDMSAAGEPDSATVLLVDDQPSMVHPGQEAYWIAVAEFMPPFDQEDHELERVAEIISKRVGHEPNSSGLL